LKNVVCSAPVRISICKGTRDADRNPKKEHDMHHRKTITLIGLFSATCLLCRAQPAPGDAVPAAQPPAERTQGHAVLTVAEGKRLIAKAVAQLPAVQAALTDGMVIICKGTTNTYVAEEILGNPVAHGAFVLGRVYPAEGGRKLPKNVQAIPEVVLVNGKLDTTLTLEDAVKKLKPGDVVIKGANLVDQERGLAGVLIGAANAGTTGTILPYVIARKAHLIIPVGLEKQCTGNIEETAAKLREPVESVTRLPSMFLLSGTVVTEIEAIQTLTGVSAFQAAAGGIGGAEGGVWLAFRGTTPQVQQALTILKDIQGEPPFVGD
jgi:hypothetical protein